MKYLIVQTALAAIAAVGVSVAAHAQQAGQPQEKPKLAGELVGDVGASLTVTSTAFSADGAIPDANSGYGDNKSPPLTWSAGPDGTRSYAVITEDPDVPRPEPIMHWIAYNIPADVTSLEGGLPADAKMSAPAGAMQGLNIRNSAGYVGPRPPADQTHHYHFQVFALDTTLDLDPAGANRAALLDAMKGHILAKGELVGTYTGKAQ